MNVGTEAETALSCRGGQQRIEFRFALYRDGAFVRDLAAAGTVTLDSTAKIVRSARFTLYEEIDQLNTRIRPYVRIGLPYRGGSAYPNLPVTWKQIKNHAITWEEILEAGIPWDEIETGAFRGVRKETGWAEFPLGIYVPSTVTRRSENGVILWDAEAYDETIILKEDCISRRLYFEAGTKYLDAVGSVLVSAGIVQTEIRDGCDASLPASREFEAGTSKLDIVNQLLDEINYYPIWETEDGFFVLEHFREPTADQTSIVYRADQDSVISDYTISEEDLCGTPNVFTAVVDSPDLDVSLRAEYVNSNPESVFSTVRRGRRISSEIYRPDAAASQQDLEAYVKRKAFEAYQHYQNITFETGIMPIHGVREVINIQHPVISGVFQETGWSIDLRAGARMQHNARRLITI